MAVQFGLTMENLGIRLLPCSHTVAIAAVVLSLVAQGECLSLEGHGIKLVFDAPENGFGVIGIENRIEETALFGGGVAGGGGFWNAAFWRDGKPESSVSLNNLSPCASRTVERDGDSLRFSWIGLSVGGETGTVDVVATVALSDCGDAAEWRLAVKNRSSEWGLASTEFPIVERVVRPGEATALQPDGNWGGMLVEHCNQGQKLVYPRGNMQLQTLAFFKGHAGLQFTALDGGAQEKTFDTTGLSMRIGYNCPDAGLPGAANAPDFAIETAAISGDWWSAAKRYRAWALRQPWAAKGPLADRRDFSRGIADVGFWMQLWGEPEVVSNIVVRALSKLGDVQLGVHWYSWHKIPFDNSYPEYFPERRGMREAVEWMERQGVFVMPYINGRLWDADIQSFSNAIPWTCKKPDGESFYIEEYGSGRRFAPMCPATSFWRGKVGEICGRLVGEIGVKAVYLDQIAAERPAPCHDLSHGHPLGGGRWWTDGYRSLMAQLRECTAGKGVAFTTECAAEPYMDGFDAFLVWLSRSPHDVPMLPAVYSGYALYFGSPQDKKDPIDAWCRMQGRDFLWGCQAGWVADWLFDDAHSEHLKFMLRLCRERLANNDFFVYGELAGEFPASDGNVMGTVWRSRDGRCRAFLVNASDEEKTMRCSASDGSTREVALPPMGVKSIDVPRTILHDLHATKSTTQQKGKHK